MFQSEKVKEMESRQQKKMAITIDNIIIMIIIDDGP